MSDINSVVIVGRLTRDPELKYTQGGTPVASFGLAVSKTYAASGEKKEQVSFFNCTAWGKLAETIAKYCKKGDRNGFTGSLQQRSWEDKDGNKKSAVEIVVQSLQFLSNKKKEDGGNEAPPADIPFNETNPFSDDSIPF